MGGSRGVSVRNFGLIWVSGRAGGPELDLARRARVRWAEIAAEVPGTGFRPNGSLTRAREDTELALLKEAAARPDAGLRDYELLDPAAVRAVNAALRGEFAGGLWCRADAAVEPRLVPAALRASLLGGTSAQAPYQWLPGREAVELAPHAVRDHTGAWHRADLVVLCPGHDRRPAPAGRRERRQRVAAACRPGPGSCRSATMTGRDLDAAAA